MMPRRTRLTKNDTDWVQVYTFLLAFFFNNNVDDKGFDTLSANTTRYKSTV